MSHPPQAVVYDAIRTPRGRGKKTGSLHEVKPVDLVVGLVDELRKRNPTLDPTRIDDVVLGVVSPLGDQGSDIAKTAALAAGLPDTVAGVQLNRFCASGDSFEGARRDIAAGPPSSTATEGVPALLIRRAKGLQEPLLGRRARFLVEGRDLQHEQSFTQTSQDFRCRAAARAWAFG